MLDYGTLEQIHSMDFHKKWVVQRGSEQEEDFLTAPEVSTVTDYATSHENVEKLQPFPLDKGALVALVIAVAIPLFPAVLAAIPLATVLKSLLSALK